MEEKEFALLCAVKTAVVKYGISGISTRNIAETAKVNDSHIYRFFKDKDDILLRAYMYENSYIFDSMIDSIKEAQKSTMRLIERARFVFDRTWAKLLEDSDRTIFCVTYYHSDYFTRASDFHSNQRDILVENLGHLFANDDTCTHTIYSMLSVLYDSANDVVMNRIEDTPENTTRVFKTLMAIYKTQSEE